MPSRKRGRTSSKQSSKVHRREQKTFSHKHFWIVFASILIVSTISILSSLNDDSITGRVAVQSFGFEPEGRTILFEASEGGIKQGTITFASETKGGKIFLEVDDSISFEGKAYSKVRVSTQDLEFSNLDLILKLEDSKLNLAGLNRNEVSLYVNGKRFPAVLIELKEGHVTYAVQGIKEAGEYVIGKSIPVEKAAAITTAIEDQPVKKTPAVEVTNDKQALAGKAVENEEPKEPGFVSRMINGIVDFFKPLFVVN